MHYFVGVDVGTGSVRAALVDSLGKIVETVVEPTKVVASVPKSSIKGIGFDATCSLVAIGENGLPVTVSPTGLDDQNINLWMDHRVSEQAHFINKLGHKLLKYVEGKISLEMEIPKLLWLKQNLPGTWKRTELFFYLTDFLTWKATGCESRLSCSLKYTSWCIHYRCSPNDISSDFTTRLGLICGTSTCHTAVSTEEIFTKNVK
ncbi:hypothetical protein TKK_0015413 [Trichogramma kaykai]